MGVLVMEICEEYLNKELLMKDEMKYMPVQAVAPQAPSMGSPLKPTTKNAGMTNPANTPFGEKPEEMKGSGVSGYMCGGKVKK